MGLPKFLAPPLLVAAISSLIWGVWLGLLRLGWVLPLPWPDQLILHGPLMVGGFLGTAIGLERAADGRKVWAFAAPVATASGALLLVLGASNAPGAVLIAAGSAFLAASALNDLRLRRTLAAATVFTGSVAWLAGNVWWCLGAVMPRVAPWWVAFLVLTVAGERLEERRHIQLTPAGRALFVAAVSLLLAGAGVHMTFVSGAGLLMLAGWLLLNDTARANLSRTGLARFSAVALLAGFCWLGVAGLVSIGADVSSSGLAYDAFLHAAFTGFVLSMIFAHAPSEIAKVAGGAPRYGSLFYLHLAILHASVVLRVSGDLFDALARFRAWGGMFTAVALLVFVLNLALARRHTNDG